MSFETQRYGGSSASLGGVRLCSDNGVFGVLSAIWLWLLALPRGMMRAEFCLGGSCSNWRSFPANRELRARRARFEIRSCPPARNHAVLRRLYGRGLSRTQFLERLCSLSVDGRTRVYYMVYWLSRMSREALMAIMRRGDFRAQDGLCDAHIAPD